MLISPFSTEHRTTLTKTILQYEYCNSMQMGGLFIKTERKETTGTCFIQGLSFLLTQKERKQTVARSVKSRVRYLVALVRRDDPCMKQRPLKETVISYIKILFVKVK